jgi:NAD(P)-dependent dehydrogenase (short-subunit alcohol dehydrogenase family)
MKIDGIAALVTGGASGLGEASARRLAAAGAKVTLLDMQEERGRTVAGEIGGHFERCDVTDEASVDAAIAGAAKVHGGARILVNCAGIVIGQKTISRKKETGEIVPHALVGFAKVVTVNLIGTFLVSSKAAAAMAALEPLPGDGERGVIVMTSSIAAEDGQLGQLAYSASKGGVLGMTLPMARDLARDGIRVMSIMPGLFHTPMFDSLTPEIRSALAANVPFPSRLGDPAEYAAMVQTICENPMLNGSAIRLDGALRLPPK